MKWLSAGLTFVNVSTVAGLLLGIIGEGLNGAIAVCALTLGLLAVAAVLAACSGSSAAPGTQSQAPAGSPDLTGAGQPVPLPTFSPM